jgi:hypothetical protein
MCEHVIVTVRERTPDGSGVTSKVGFNGIIGLVFKTLPRHG